MKALSVRQPWAWLLVNGWKNIENRPRRTSVRGPVLIHASLGMTAGDYDAAVLFVAGWAPRLAAQIPSFEKLIERGGIVGQVTILDCVDHHDSEWFTGPWGYVVTDQKPLPFVRCKGQLGFWEVR
jgi:hypothetical protein